MQLTSSTSCSHMLGLRRTLAALSKTEVLNCPGRSCGSTSHRRPGLPATRTDKSERRAKQGCARLRSIFKEAQGLTASPARCCPGRPGQRSPKSRDCSRPQGPGRVLQPHVTDESHPSRELRACFSRKEVSAGPMSFCPRSNCAKTSREP